MNYAIAYCCLNWLQLLYNPLPPFQWQHQIWTCVTQLSIAFLHPHEHLRYAAQVFWAFSLMQPAASKHWMKLSAQIPLAFSFLYLLMYSRGKSCCCAGFGSYDKAVFTDLIWNELIWTADPVHSSPVRMRYVTKMLHKVVLRSQI